MGENPTKEEKAKTIEAHLAIELLEWFEKDEEYHFTQKDEVMK